MHVASALSIERLTALTAHQTRHVPVVTDRRQVVPVAYRHHTPGTYSAPAPTDLAILLAQPEVVVGTSGAVQVTWTQVGQQRRRVVVMTQLVEERLLLQLVMMMMMMMLRRLVVIVIRRHRYVISQL